MATKTVTQANPGRSNDEGGYPPASIASSAGIPFDDHRPDDPAGERFADRTEAYDSVRTAATRRLVKLVRGVINESIHRCAYIGSLCDLGHDRAYEDDREGARAIFEAIKLIDLKEGERFYELHGLIEALIDRLPVEGGAA